MQMTFSQTVRVLSYRTREHLAELTVDLSSDTVESLLRAIAGIKALSDAENPLRFVTRMWYLPSDAPDAVPVEIGLNGHDRALTLSEVCCENAGHPQSLRTVLIEGCKSNGGALTDLYCAALTTSEWLRSQVADLGARLTAMEEKQRHYDNVCQHFVKETDSSGYAPLHRAAMNDNTILMESLLVAGADVNLQTDNDDAETPLHLAAKHGNLAAALALIRAKADVNRLNGDGWAPLHWAANDDCIAIIKALVAAQADVHTRAPDERTPLHSAAQDDNAKAICALAAAGADVDAVEEEGWTAIHLAALNGHTKTIEALIVRGADVCRSDKYMGTPLHTASRRGLAETAKALLTAGADLNTLNNLGHTPLHTVATASDKRLGLGEEGRTECMKVLIAAGAAPIELSFEERASMKGSVLRLLKKMGKLL